MLSVASYAVLWGSVLGVSVTSVGAFFLCVAVDAELHGEFVEGFGEGVVLLRDGAVAGGALDVAGDDVSFVGEVDVARHGVDAFPRNGFVFQYVVLT